jgi:hypothetical protein
MRRTAPTAVPDPTVADPTVPDATPDPAVADPTVPDAAAPDPAAGREFDRQVEQLLAKGYPAAAGLSRRAFLDLVQPLRARLSVLPAADPAAPEAAGAAEAIPFVLVVAASVVPVERTVPLVELAGRAGFVQMDPLAPTRFAPIPEVAVPPAAAYLITDVDTGPSTLGVRPQDALPGILAAGRSPLTIEEGVALVTHFPEVLRERNSFQMLASRAGDRRVPALWVTAQRRPRLGWCWAGNPHSWLGMASCAARIA